VNNETSDPEILEAEWDYEQVDALFDDLDNGAEIQHVQVRSASSDGPANQPSQRDQAVTLREAQSLLKRGDAKAIQIRYAFDNESWCDTLMIGPNTIRIIRTRNA